MGSSATRKSSNEHGFFVGVTSLNKIGEGRIQNLTGDVLFPVTFKCATLIVIREDPRPYWCIMSNNVLMCIDDHADLPCPWTEVLTSQVLANRTSWPVQISPMNPAKMLELAPSIWSRPARNKKTQGLKFCKDRKHEAGSTNAELKS